MQQGALVKSRPGRAAPSGSDDFAALYRLTDRLYRARSLEDVYDAALDAIAETLGCRRASILLFDDSGVMRFVAWRGLSEAYRRAVDGHSPWRPGDLQAEPMLVEDISRTDEAEAVKQAIRGEGITALAFIPLVVRGGVVGKFMTYYEAAHAFTTREIELAVTIARQVGFSIERARADEARYAAEEALRQQEERSRHMLENAPVMIWMSDEAGHCLHLNRMLRAFWGVEEDRIRAFDWSTTIHPDDVQEIGGRMAAAIAGRASVRVKGRYRNAEGEYRVLITDAQPRFSCAGAFLGMIGVNVDVTDRERSEMALRESEERFRLVVEAAPSGMVIITQAGRIALVNAQAERLFGYSRDELVGESVEILVPERFRSRHSGLRDALHERSGPPGRDKVFQARRRDGSEFPAEIGLSPIGAPTGTLTLAAIVDVGERLRAESQRELLLAELNHRVKNTLAVVQGIAHQTFKGDGASAAARDAFQGRLHALSVAHNMLTQSSWSHAPLARLAEDTLGTRTSHRDRISLGGPPILLEPKAATAVAMALHELLTNAVKYGALSNEAGTVSVRWEAAPGPPPRFRLVWQEAGGPPVSPPTRTGFGSRLIRRILADDLEGSVTLDFRPGGVVCEIEGNLLPPEGDRP